MTPARLLRELEPLTHDARARRLVEVGRLSRGDPRVADTLAQLERGGWYERSLSLRACHGSRDVGRLLRGLVGTAEHVGVVEMDLPHAAQPGHHSRPLRPEHRP